MNSHTREVGQLSVRADVVPGSLNEEARTVDVVWTTGARVRRYSWFDGPWYEELSTDPAHVRMGRLQSGRAPVLLQHNSYDPDAHQGVVVSARLENGKGVASLRFLTGDPDADKTWNKVRQGVLTSVSVGYSVHRLEKVEEIDGVAVMRATDWEPYEISPVSLPADPDAHMRSAAARTNPCEVITRGEAPQTKGRPMGPENNPTPEQLQAERQRALTISTLTRKHDLPAELADELIRSGKPLEEARAVILDKLAERSDAIQIDGHQRVEWGASHDGIDQRVRHMAAALASRAGCREKMPEQAQQYARLSMIDMARLCLESRGISPRLLSASQILTRAYHSTSDFKALLGETGNRVLLDGYNSYPGGLKQISRQSSAKDFRAKSFLRLGEAPKLLKVNEHGEVKSGTMASSKTGYSIATFARIFGLTRQAIINDDLSAFDMVRLYGRAAAELEAKTIADLLIANQLADGTTAIFSVAHKNLAAAGSDISISSLGEAFRAMRVQKGLDADTPLNIVPRYLVVPAALEVNALQHVAEINAAQADDVNPFGTSRKLEVVIDPRLDGANPNSWYVAADPNGLPTIEHSYLDGQTGPEIIEEEGFTVEGTQWKCRMDFGAAVISHEGLYKNPGAAL
jgi:HK97 family phage prohead protease